MSGALGRLTNAVKTGAFVLAGEAATNVVSGYIPIGQGNRMLTTAKKFGVGLVLSMLGRRVLGSSAADAVLLGAVLAPMREVAVTLPVIGPALTPTPIAGYAGYANPVRRIRGYANPANAAGLGRGAGMETAVGYRSPIGV